MNAIIATLLIASSTYNLDQMVYRACTMKRDGAIDMEIYNHIYSLISANKKPTGNRELDSMLEHSDRKQAQGIVNIALIDYKSSKTCKRPKD